MSNPRVAVVGVGPVGSILSAYYARSGVPVVAIDIFKEHLDHIREKGISIEGAAELEVKVENTYYSVEDAAEAGEKFDGVFVCVKATAIKFVAPGLPALLNDDGVAISWQNGLDTEAGLLEVLGPERMLRGAVNYAGNLMGIGTVRMTFFNPPNYLGAAVKGNPAAEDMAKRVAASLSEANLQTEFTDDIHHHVWEKAIRNAALMPVSAITGMDMAQVMESPSSLFLVEKLLTESMAVSAEVGYEFDQKFYDDTLEYYRKAGHHMPSMRGDVEDGRRTETEFLNHRIAEYGERHGVDSPYNRALANCLLCIDELTGQRQRKSDK